LSGCCPAAALASSAFKPATQAQPFSTICQAVQKAVPKPATATQQPYFPPGQKVFVGHYSIFLATRYHSNLENKTDRTPNHDIDKKVCVHGT
jgi:hypothetical protein